MAKYLSSIEPFVGGNWLSGWGIAVTHDLQVKRTVPVLLYVMELKETYYANLSRNEHLPGIKRLHSTDLYKYKHLIKDKWCRILMDI